MGFIINHFFTYSSDRDYRFGSESNVPFTRRVDKVFFARRNVTMKKYFTLILFTKKMQNSLNCDTSCNVIQLPLSSPPSPVSLFPSFPCPSIPFFPLPLYPVPSPALSPPFPSLIFPYPSNSFPSFPVPSIYPSSSAPAPCLLSLSLPSLSLYLFPPSLFPYLPTALK